MLLAIDIGNSAIKFGLFEGEALSSRFSIQTNRNATADEIKRAVGDRLPSSVEAIMVCSVVPDVEPAIRECLRESTGIDPAFVRNSFDLGLKIN
jgi:type III pantothenate kinase